MAALMMSLKPPSWIYCTCVWLATIAVMNAQEVIKPKPDTKGNTNYPALTSEPIEVAALGRPLYPGMLYDCRKDTFIPGVTLWEKKSLREDLDTRQQPKTYFDFSSSDSLSSKASLLDVSASLKASFLGGLVEVGGSAKFLRDTKSSNQQSRVTMHYSETTRFDQLTMTQLGHITYPQVFDQKTATHVVTAVLYGAQAFMVFDRRFSEEEEKQEIEGKLNVMVRKIPQFSIEGQGAINMTDGEKKMAETIACTFHGDFHLNQNPTTYTEAIDVFKKLPTILKENPESAVPVKVWLYPLSLLDSKAAQLEREITTRLVSNTVDIIEELGEVERPYNDLSRNTLVNNFNDIKKRLQSFQSSFSIYKTMLQKAVARVLPAIRGGEMEEKSLEDVLMIHYSSPFTADRLNQWLDGAQTELNLLSSYTNKLEGITTEDSDGLNTILFDPDIDVVVCLTFTSLEYEDLYLSNLTEFLKSDKFKELDGEHNMVSVASVRKWFNDPAVISKMRENFSLFRSFSEANKNEKRYRFIISAISDSSSPGSSIRLYEKGKLTDTQFQPVSKPPPPEVKDVRKRSVSLKLQKSPTGETVQYRVEYQQLNEGQWHAINTPDEDYTLTGLEFGRQYMIRYRIVGKVGVSEASDTIGPITTPDPDPLSRSDLLRCVGHLSDACLLEVRLFPLEMTGRKAIVEHEFLHALGFSHQHTRYDRDDYVTINYGNITQGYESSRSKSSGNVSVTQGTSYDYYSVMHFDKNAFSNDSSVSFLDHCSFDDESLCQMSICSAADYGWKRVNSVKGINATDHTYLGRKQNGSSLFMHFSTEGRNQGDAARLESKTLTPTRDCKVQCLQFYYYHSGHQSDQLNIWIREYQNEADSTGTLRLMDQITETPGNYWKLHHVPLNANKSFQVVFEGRKGAGNSSGGFSLDDINVSETECPFIWQMRDIEKAMDSGFGYYLSPLYYSSDGYRFGAELSVSGNGLSMYVYLASGANDEQLKWPCPWRQITVQILDQNPHIQKRMSFEWQLLLGQSLRD
ncbi:neoverrucotoxin subunit alpha-like isoform X2 [Pseudorasbora parva]|uniref:neoverrucotoxin subunit alpha-like isoform X2 n=1 Tax=Pseudorasbora parva TaxID=51549 RepID=UPI00351F18F6